MNAEEEEYILPLYIHFDNIGAFNLLFVCISIPEVSVLLVIAILSLGICLHVIKVLQLFPYSRSY